MLFKKKDSSNDDVIKLLIATTSLLIALTEELASKGVVDGERVERLMIKADKELREGTKYGT